VIEIDEQSVNKRSETFIRHIGHARSIKHNHYVVCLLRYTQ